jgi:hypothetical protein
VNSQAQHLQQWTNKRRAAPNSALVIAAREESRRLRVAEIILLIIAVMAMFATVGMVALGLVVFVIVAI